MPRRIKVDGTTYVVPDDATDDEITGIVDGGGKNGRSASYDPAADAASHAATPFSGATPHPAVDLSPGASTDPYRRAFGNDDPAEVGRNMVRHAVAIPAGIAHTVAHPYKSLIAPTVDAGRAAYQSARQGNYSDAAQHAMDAIPVAGPWARNVENEAHDQGAIPALLNMGVDVAGAEAMGKVPVAKTLAKTGNALQGAGKGIIHDTIGTVRKDVRRGNDPAQAYFDEGIGPSMSMDSIARKSAAAKQGVGSSIGDAYDAADQSGVTIPARKVYSQAVRPPIDNMMTVKSGPGGGPLGQVKRYDRTFDPVANDAAANVDYSPSEVWGIKRNIAQNTSWSDPTMLDLKSVRQQNVGAIQDVLNDAVPEVEPLNARYGNVTALEERSAARAAQPNSIPLTKLIRHGAGSVVGSTVGAMSGGPVGAAVGAAGGALLDSVPVKTTVASGLYGAGTMAGKAAAGAARVPAVVGRGSALIAPKSGPQRRRAGTSASH